MKSFLFIALMALLFIGMIGKDSVGVKEELGKRRNTEAIATKKCVDKCWKEIKKNPHLTFKSFQKCVMLCENSGK